MRARATPVPRSRAFGALLVLVVAADGIAPARAHPRVRGRCASGRTALGVEFNFPVSHNWMTASPVDFAVRAGDDGSASVRVGNIDRPYGMQWRVELTLRPGRSVLEQRTTLYNRSDTRHRFYWWTNAGVEVWDDSRILYPMRFTASHGFADVDTWPVAASGVDLSVVGNHTFGPVSRFRLGSREPFMAVYHPRTRAGVVYYMHVGLWDEAVGLLGRSYPRGDGVVSEPGMPRPSEYPLVAWYRGCCRQMAGGDPAADFRAAAGMPVTYVFPKRPQTFAVRDAALAADPDDATAHFLLGSLHLSGGQVEPAMREWETTRRLKPDTPTLHRSSRSRRRPTSPGT